MNAYNDHADDNNHHDDDDRHHHRAYTGAHDAFHNHHHNHHHHHNSARTHDYRISAALRGLEQVAVDRFDGDRDALDHDAFAALAAALQCVGQQGAAGALYRVRLVVAPSIEHVRRAVAAPSPMTTATPHARTLHGLLMLERVGRRIVAADDVRACALARLVPAPSALCFAAAGAAAGAPPPVLSCEWQNLFRATPVAAGSAPFYFFPEGQPPPQPQQQQEEAAAAAAALRLRGEGGPPFRLYRDSASPILRPSYSPFFQEEADLVAPTPEVQGCVWGVVVNPDCADPDSRRSGEYDDDPDLEWPAQMCVASALCHRRRTAAAAADADAAAAAFFEPPRFPFLG